MTQITLDASVSGQLHNLNQPVELCDPSGRVLGRFIPLIDMSEWEPISPDISEEELDRREQSKERYTTEQVLAYLMNLEKQEYSGSDEWSNDSFSLIDEGGILPPGQHPHDPWKQDMDPIGFALNKLRTYLLWIDEHRSALEQLRPRDPVNAEAELKNLKDSAEQALTHLQRLMELLLAGYTIDPNKRLPKELSQEGANWLLSYLERSRKSQPPISCTAVSANTPAPALSATASANPTPSLRPRL